jgi:methionyl-tRNA synthetase
MEEKKFYVTTTIPYVNAAPHIGHALEFVQADVIARSERAKLGKENVYFLSGTDDNAIKNVQAAENAGMPVAEFVSRNSSAFQELLAKLNVEVDDFIRTTEERHRRGAQALWSATKKEDIYKKTYKGLYCVGCELFYKPEELDERGECFEHPGKKLEEVQEENYFFKLQNYAERISKLIESDTLRIIPETRKNEALSLIRGGLEDFSISRPVERSKNWGIPVPGDPRQTMYVWYDALANYITALGYPDRGAELFKKFWLENSSKMHILGKGVLRFHAIYWPAMLMSADLPLPTVEFVHGYITAEGRKISKTAGNTVDPLALAEKYGSDAVRYFLLREIPATEDGDWSDAKFRERYNADLANGVGNFVSRVLTLAEIEKEFPGELKPEKEITKHADHTRGLIRDKIEEFKFREALQAIWEFLSFGDAYINRTAPWDIENEEKKLRTIFNLVVILDNVAAFIKPFLPDAAQKITSCIEWDGKLKVKKCGVLFPRLH